ncbi:porin [Aliamphritea ceti]|uniref:porin n=1 Tax=Aliamphritea ceti TaxID=1524258 RepID=UPI0021C2BBC9|nr:porin [Aliamphritea ceti]
MKKSIIALAVAGALTAPLAQADATLYGKFEMRLVDAKNKNTEIQSDDFRLGVKGSVDTGMEGVEGIFGYETEINPDGDNSYTSATDSTPAQSLNARKAFVGMKGDFGTVKVGRFANPAEAVVAKVGNWSESATGFTHDLNPDFIGSAISYQTPDLNGFDAYVAIVAEGSPTGSTATAVQQSQNDVDSTIVGGNYNGGGFSVSAAYWEVANEYVDGANTAAAGTSGDRSYTGISGSYDFGGMVNVALGYQDYESGTSATTQAGDVETTSLLVSKSFDNVTVWANYHDYDYAVSASTGQWKNEFGIGAAYFMGDTYIDVEYIDASGEANQADNDVLSLGYTINF